jgi:hypothetical protein
MTGASAAVRAIAAQKRGDAGVVSLQEVHRLSLNLESRSR